MARETSLWAWLKRAGEDLGAHLHMTRVENLLEEGFPDVEGCYQGRGFWVELKSAARPKRAETRILGPRDIRPRQPPWLQARWMAGGNAWWLVQVGERHSARRYLVPGYLHISDVPEEWFMMNAGLTGGSVAHEIVKFAATDSRG